MFTVDLDFDSTMVSCDALFRGLAVERGLVDRMTGPGKGVRRIHFAPAGTPPRPETTVANAWSDIRRLLFSTGANGHARG